MPNKGSQKGENKVCPICTKNFYAYPYVLLKGYGKFCSHKCYSRSINKGDRVGYPGLHAWVKKERGKAKVCEWCSSTRAVQWANISHQYKRVLDDWMPLCKKCHFKYDNVIEKALITKRKKDICFFTIVDDSHFYPEGTHLMINSFKRYHPDIDLIVYRQDMVDKVFKENDINFYRAKPTFAKLLTNEYKCVVNIDADHIILNRLDEIIKMNYDIAGPSNKNDYEDASFENITEHMYIQAGIVASTQPEFWDIWEDENRKAMNYLRKENDILNLVVWNHPRVTKMRFKFLDKDRDYYGCKSLGREPLFYIKDGKTYCSKDDGQVVAYHFARGNVFPKLDIPNMPLTDEVKQRWMEIACYGQTIKIGGLRNHTQ